jgi:hypothetical protein
MSRWNDPHRFINLRELRDNVNRPVSAPENRAYCLTQNAMIYVPRDTHAPHGDRRDAVEQGDITMFHFETQIPVFLEFRAMSEPVSISVPVYVFRYLNTHGERAVTHNGEVIYRQPPLTTALPELRMPGASPVTA